MNLDAMIANQQERLKTRQELPAIPEAPLPRPIKDPASDPENLIDLATAMSKIVRRHKNVEINVRDGQTAIVALLFAAKMLASERTCPTCMEMRADCPDPWHHGGVEQP